MLALAPPPQFKRFPKGLSVAPRNPDAVPVELICQIGRSQAALPEGDGQDMIRFKLANWVSLRPTRGLQPTEVEVSIFKYNEEAAQISGRWVRLLDQSLIDLAKDDGGTFTLVTQSFGSVSIMRQIGISDDATFVGIGSGGMADSAGHCSIHFSLELVP